METIKQKQNTSIKEETFINLWELFWKEKDIISDILNKDRIWQAFEMLKEVWLLEPELALA